MTLIKDSLADFMEDHGHSHRTAAMGFYSGRVDGAGLQIHHGQVNICSKGTGWRSVAGKLLRGNIGIREFRLNWPARILAEDRPKWHTSSEGTWSDIGGWGLWLNWFSRLLIKMHFARKFIPVPTRSLKKPKFVQAKTTKNKAFCLFSCDLQSFKKVTSG